MNNEIIGSRQQDPLGNMLLDYWNGRKDASVEVESATLEMWNMAGSAMFRTYEEMDALERTALCRCRGRIVDVGAGSGCHSLYLQEKGALVDAIDISPGCVEVMRLRGVANVHQKNIFDLSEKRYDTLLMLMNGLGICGTLDGCNLFLQFAGTILRRGGQILADSTDLSSLEGGETFHVDDGYHGETQFIMRYKNVVSEPFEWLYIDFATLHHIAQCNKMKCECLIKDGEGRYLARIWKGRW